MKTVEELIDKLGFTFNIPHAELEYDEENDDNTYIADIVGQVVLTFLAAKIRELGARASTTNVASQVSAYKEAANNYSDIFLSLELMVKPDVDMSMASVNFFKVPDESGLSLASSIATRLNREELFARVNMSEAENPITVEDNQIPGVVIKMLIGNEALCQFNEDRDAFILRVADGICYGILDGYVEFGERID